MSGTSPPPCTVNTATPLQHPVAEVFLDVPADEPAGGDKEAHIDALIERIRTLLGTTRYRRVFDAGLNAILGNIRQDLEEFGVVYDEWFSERSLSESNAVEAGIERLQKSGHVYEKNGALWFSSTDFGDEKDRVIVRDNGQTTYFASDIAYHCQQAGTRLMTASSMSGVPTTTAMCRG